MTVSYAIRSCTMLSALVGSMAYAQFPLVDISLEHDQANDQLKISLRANDFDFGDIVSNMVFTIRWPDNSPATLGFGSSEWCPSPTTALPLAPSAMVTPGNGFKYRTWNAIGLAPLSEIQDNGGCGQTLLSDTWTHVFTIAVNNDPGGTVFTIAEDQYAIDNNRTFYVSLNGQPSTGGVYTFSTQVEPVARAAQRVLSLWPNPTAGLLILDSGPDAPVIMEAEVLDSSGRVVKRWGALPSRTLDLRGLQVGAYRVRVITGDEVHTAPVVIE